MATFIGILEDDTQEMINHLEHTNTAGYDFIYHQSELPNLDKENEFINSMVKEIGKFYNIKSEYVGICTLEDFIISEWYFVRLI